MSIADFLTKNAIGKEFCFNLGNNAETVVYDQYWIENREYLRGIVKSVEDGILILEVVGHGDIYINCQFIQSFWASSFNYYKAIKAIVTKKPAGSRYLK